MNVGKLNDLAQSILEEYRKQANGTRRWLQDYHKEIQAYKDYRGREIFELLQNADDARSDCVEISIDKSSCVLTIVNSGENTIPFDEEGVQSIMLSDLSPKKGKKMIGAKGLGFRSVLNWSESIEIRSDNVRLRFGNDIAIRQWVQLKPLVDDAARYEREAGNDGRKVPMAILAMPEITSLPGCEAAGTSVVLAYDKKYEEDILNDLEGFTPESLLFLHHIKQVSIDVGDGQVRRYRKSLCEECGEVTVWVLDGKRWAIATEHGTLDGSSGEYEAACAFCIDALQESYKIFSYFPTNTVFPFPCIFHATLELDSSRNALVAGNASNKAMMEKLAGCAAVMAEYLKTVGHDWQPYRLMRPGGTGAARNEYVERLVSSIKNVSGHGGYIPTLDGRFADEAGYYYYACDGFFDVVNNEAGKRVFPKLRLNGAPAYAQLERQDPDFGRNVSEYALTLTGDIDRLARYITTLLLCHRATQCDLLPDADGEIITGTAYVNTGVEIEDIPDFREIRYVDERLVARLKEMLGLHGDEADRDLVRQLRSITNVSSTDVNAVTLSLLPKAKDAMLAPAQKRELLLCLFKSFVKRNGEVSYGNENIYLPSQSGEWRPASEMVMTDRRFPDGFDNLGVDYAYSDNDSVQYPEFLADTGATPEMVQRFYEKLGVNLYFKHEKVNYGDDAEYIAALGLPGNVSRNCMRYRLGKDYNSVQVGDNAFFAALSLHDLLRIIEKSGYSETVCGGQKIYWFKNSLQLPEHVSLSYAAYRLRKIKCVDALKYYVIDEDTWLAGFDPGEKLPIAQEYRQKMVLEALGAKQGMDGFTVEELYDAVNNVERVYGNDTFHAGIQAIYHSLKMALDTKKELPGLSENRRLRMLCRRDGKYEFADSREIYYSDNDELPDEVTGRLPMLVMGRREGEQMVKRLFGCRVLKDIDVKIVRKVLNECLSRELNKRLEKRKPHLLAFTGNFSRRTAAGAPSFNEDTGKRLAGFAINVVASAGYTYSLGGQSLLADDEMSMADGELLCSGGQYYICSREATLEGAMFCPPFNNAVVKALCIALNLSSSETANRFYRIFTSSESELDYYRSREIDEALWAECENRFGMASADVAFWERVFAVNGREFDKAGLCEDRVAYLIEKLGLEHERLESPGNFHTYHLQRLRAVKSGYVAGYMHYTYMQIVGDRNLHKEYKRRCDKFNSEDWLKGILEHDDNKYRLELDYDGLVLEAMKERFDGYEPVADVMEHHRHEEYLQGLDEYELSDEDKSLLYFDGYEDYFARLRAEAGLLLETPASAGDAATVLPIIEADMGKSCPAVAQGGGGSTETGGRRKVSARRKAQLGNDAEDKVFRALQVCDEYEIGQVYSKHLNKEGGDDGKGYDLEYRKKGEALFRCLEIKHFDGTSIILTGNEYRTSQLEENRGRYDLALVSGDKIEIIRNAFSNPERFSKVANAYTVYLTIGGVDIWGDGTATVKHGASLPNELGAVLEL